VGLDFDCDDLVEAQFDDEIDFVFSVLVTQVL